jgi:outer membrane protein assembly factor BamB
MGAIALNGEYGYFAGFDGALYAVELSTGRIAWKHVVTERPLSNGSQPVLVQNQVIVGTESSSIYAVSAATGVFLWKTDLRAGLLAPLVSSGSRLLVGTSNNMFYQIDLDTGETATVPVEGPIMDPPIIYSDIIFITTIKDWLSAIH